MATATTATTTTVRRNFHHFPQPNTHARMRFRAATVRPAGRTNDGLVNVSVVRKEPKKHPPLSLSPQTRWATPSIAPPIRNAYACTMFHHPVDATRTKRLMWVVCMRARRRQLRRLRQCPTRSSSYAATQRRRPYYESMLVHAHESIHLFLAADLKQSHRPHRSHHRHHHHRRFSNPIPHSTQIRVMHSWLC